jgi:hypothetical protein
MAVALTGLTTCACLSDSAFQSYDCGHEWRLADDAFSQFEQTTLFFSIGSGIELFAHYARLPQKASHRKRRELPLLHNLKEVAPSTPQAAEMIGFLAFQCALISIPVWISVVFLVVGSSLELECVTHVFGSDERHFLLALQGFLFMGPKSRSLVDAIGLCRVLGSRLSVARYKDCPPKSF